MSKRDQDKDPDAEPEPMALVEPPPPFPLESAFLEAMTPDVATEEALEEAHRSHTPDPWDIPSGESNEQQGSQSEAQTSNQQGQLGQQTSNEAGNPGPEAGNLGSGKQAGNQQQAGELAGSPPPASLARAALSVTGPETAPCDQPPATLAATLEDLPQWQARYVLSLYEHGGIAALAQRRCNVSAESVEKFQSSNPAFARACSAAVNFTTDLVEAATYKGATVGDLVPKYHQGLIVGYTRKRDTKAAELMLRLRGRLKDEAATTVNTTTKVTIVESSAVPSVVADTLARLYAARGKQSPTIDI